MNKQKLLDPAEEKSEEQLFIFQQENGPKLQQLMLMF